MDASEIRTAYHDWSDGDLVGLLHAAGDCLPGDAVLEIALRNETTMPLLREILSDRSAWASAGHSSWAAIHAFLLYGDFQPDPFGPDYEDRWSTANAAVRYLLAYGLDDGLLADFPLIVASQGPWAWKRLPGLAEDRARPTRERVAWVLGLATAAQRCGEKRDALLDVLRSLAQHADEPLEVRAAAARCLLDSVRPADRQVVEAVAAAEAEEGGLGDLLPGDVAEAFARGTPDLSPYNRNWQACYYKPPGMGPQDAETIPELPLPSWREEDIARTLRACEPLFAADGTAGIREVAEFFLDTLVRRRLAPVRLWRTLDVAAACRRAVAEARSLPDVARSNFAPAAKRLIELLDHRELIELGDAGEMTGWVERRSDRLASLLR